MPRPSIPEQLALYKSKNPKINSFLAGLHRDYERLNSQIYFVENEVQSLKNKREIGLSTQAQEQNQVSELRAEIEKLEALSVDIDRAIEHPHLGESYQIDLLFVKKVYDKLRLKDFDFIHKQALKELMALKSTLFKFYLAKSKESIRQFEKSTAIE